MQGVLRLITKNALAALPSKRSGKGVLIHGCGGGSFCDCFNHFSPNSEFNRCRQLGRKIWYRHDLTLLISNCGEFDGHCRSRATYEPDASQCDRYSLNKDLQSRQRKQPPCPTGRKDRSNGHRRVGCVNQLLSFLKTSFLIL